jgi:hypothetical protein
VSGTVIPKQHRRAAPGGLASPKVAASSFGVCVWSVDHPVVGQRPAERFHRVLCNIRRLVRAEQRDQLGWTGAAVASLVLPVGMNSEGLAEILLVYPSDGLFGEVAVVALEHDRSLGAEGHDH